MASKALHAAWRRSPLVSLRASQPRAATAIPSKICSIDSHVASAGHVTSAAYSCERGGCITQMSYLWCYLAVARGLRISENSVKVKFSLPQPYGPESLACEGPRYQRV